MGYRPNKLRLSHFYRYTQRVFSFQQQVKWLNDHRLAPDVKTGMERFEIEPLEEMLLAISKQMKRSQLSVFLLSSHTQYVLK